MEQIIGRTIDDDAPFDSVVDDAAEKSALALRPEAEDVSAAEVVRALADCVLIPNGFQIAYINFPDSDARENAMPEFPDIIALPPRTKANFDLLVIGNPTALGLTDEQKLTQRDFEASLLQVLPQHAIEGARLRFGRVKYGTALGGSPARNVWLPAFTDLFFRLTDREHWSLGIAATELIGLFAELRGEVA